MSEESMSQPRYLKRLVIQNFQSHVYQDIEFDPEWNLLVGTSNSGKSAILRAMGFLLYNKPDDLEDILNYEADTVTVTGYFSDGYIVKRERSKKKVNSVEVTYPNGEVESFPNFGTLYPPQVLRALGNPPVDVEQGPLAVRDQLAPLYIVHLSPTKLARVMSDLCNVSKYEVAAKNLASGAREFSKDIKQYQTRILKIDSDLQDYFGLDDEIERLDSLESTLEEAELLENEIEILNRLRTEYAEINRSGKDASKKRARSKKISALSDELQMAKTAHIEFSSLTELKQQHLAAKKALVDAEARLAHSSKIAECREALLDAKRNQKALEELHRAKTTYADILLDGSKATNAKAKSSKVASQINKDLLFGARTLLTEVKDLKKFSQDYNDISESLKQTENKKKDSKAELEKLSVQLDGKITELIALGLLCPTCRQPIGVKNA
jgi:chromosome segregation ATPase